MVSEDDYHLWGYLHQEKLSNDGQWASFQMSYESGLDTLFVKNTSTHKTYKFSKSFNGEFNRNTTWFAYHSQLDGINLINLTSGQNRKFSEVQKYDWSRTGQFFAIYNKINKKLLIVDVVNNSEIEIDSVTEYSFNFIGDIIAYIQNKNNQFQVSQLKLKKLNSTIEIYSSNSGLNNLKWHQRNNSFIFLEEFKNSRFIEKSHIIHYFDKKIKSFDHRLFKNFPKNTFVSNLIIDKISSLKISNGEYRVIFPIQKWHRISDTINRSKKNEIEIWHYKDQEIYPRQKIKDQIVYSPRLGSWDIINMSFFEVSNAGELYILNNSNTHVLVHSQSDYLPLFEYQGEYSDYFIIDLANKTKELFLEKMNLGVPILSSPSGRYFTYFKDNNWWIYDVNKKTHRVISRGIKEGISKRPIYSNKTFEPVGFPIWDKNEKSIFISGLKDVWKITLKDLKTIRITDGYKAGLKYEIYKGSSLDPNSRINRKNKVHTLDNSNEIILTVTNPNTKFTGFKLWNKNKKLQTIVFDDVLVDELYTTKNNKIILFKEQRYDTSPKLKIFHNNANKIIFESNKHEENYYWGSSKLIDYKNTVGDSLQGILYYPSNFDSSLKYPLIVIPYEDQTRYYNQFFIPSLYKDGETLISVLNLKGYFVLLPDIKYEKGNVGISAADCIISATNQVKQLEFINPNGIGIMGHSFGGYETYFTITQTDLFSAAIAGSGISDLFSSSLSVNVGFFNRPEMNYYEFGQNRMEEPFYKLQNKYIANSPIHQSNKIHTPLLAWFGKEDTRINWNQGLSMYLTLRRMKKENIFLVYPGEGHVLSKKTNQKDLTSKVLDWFAYHLKGEKPTKWITEHNQY